MLSGPSADGLEGVEGGREVLEAGPVDFVELVEVCGNDGGWSGEGSEMSWEAPRTWSEAIIGVSEAAEFVDEAAEKNCRMSVC